jgi:GMC oxidoreductase/FAD binding domain
MRDMREELTIDIVPATPSGSRTTLSISTLLTGGRLAVFGRGPDGSLGRTWQLTPNGAWSDWRTLEVPIRSAPAAAQNTDGHLDVFAIGADRRLYNMWQQDDITGWWSEWSLLGPQIRSDPVVVQNGEGRLELFAIGADGRLGHMWQWPRDPGGWSHWETLGPTVRTAPTVFQNADGRLELFAIGPDGLLGHNWQQAPEVGGWSGWRDLEVAIEGEPTLFQNGDGRLELLALGPGGRLGHMWQLRGGAGGWAEWEDLGAEWEDLGSEWEDLGPAIGGKPAVFQNADGRLELFAAGPRGQLGHMWQQESEVGGWSAWEELGPELTGDPSAFQNADGRLEVFAAGPGGELGHTWQLEGPEGSGWSGWETLGPELGATRLAVCQCGDRGTVEETLLREVERRASSSWTLFMPERLSADVCVIGAGPAGVTLSRELIKGGASVILLESGGWTADPLIEELNRGIAEGPLIKDYREYLTDGRSRQVQGAAARWGPGWIMPFGAIDFADRPWVGYSSWPVSQSELAPYELQAAHTFGFEPFPTRHGEGPLVALCYQYPPEPQVFKVTFLELLTSNQFRAEFGTTALQFERGGDRVRSVRCARLAGGEAHVTASTFIVAAGGVENARLLLLNRDAVPDAGDMVGRCFMEHPHVFAGVVRLPDIEELAPYVIGGRRLEVLALADRTQQEERLLNASVQIRREYHTTAPEGFLNCQLILRAEQAPNPDSRVLLGERRDRFGCLQPRLEWRVLEQDWDSIVRTTTRVASEIEVRYDTRVHPTFQPDQPWPGSPTGPNHSEYSTWGYHHLGTTRMSEAPADGVVDRNCRVHGTDNLFICGSSVFPTGSCANPTFMIVTLAHRLADHLVAMR